METPEQPHMPESEAETLASVLRGLADLEAGRVQDLDEAFNELDARQGA
jgi:predicted transcriptional regulator